MRMRSGAIAIVAAAALCAPAWAQPATPGTDPNALPDLRVAAGDGAIAEAWLIAPTTRYRHFVQGSRYEAGGVRVRTREGSIVTLLLDGEHVFEDRQPRLADIDGDGEAELLLVLTALDAGASLVAYELDGDRLTPKAQTEYIGQPYRWLNPAGVADFDGDGRAEVALVAMPHLAKRLELYRYQGGEFVPVVSVEDVSNHRNGSTNTGMAAVADFDHDGISDLIVPDGDRLALRVLGFAGGTPRDLGRFEMEAPIDGEFTLSDGPLGWTLTVGLENGQTGGLVRVGQ